VPRVLAVVLVAIATPLVAVACGGARGTPVAPPAPVASAAPVAPVVASAPPGAPSRPLPDPARFAALRDVVLAELLGEDPSYARDLGLHEYDGKVAAVSSAALEAKAARLASAASDLARVDPASLSPDDAIDLAELETWVKTRQFDLIDMDAPHRSPQSYETLFDVSGYLDRDYAPVEERAKRLVEQEENALAEIPHVRENLTPPLSKPIADVAARNFAGFATYLRGDVATQMGSKGDDAARKRFAAANGALAKAASDLAQWLKKEALRGDQSHILGPERFRKLLAVEEGLSIGLDAFERMNEDDLAVNKAAYEALAARVKPQMVSEAHLFETADRMVHDARNFVVDDGLVDLPSNDVVVVRETPPYERYNSASIDMSGPFEAVRSAYFQITVPDRAMSEKMRRDYLGTLGDLLGTAIHEAYPGHFVQGRWAERAPTRVQRAFASYSFVEGWAHYSEQLMIDEGFGHTDPANELAMRHGALLRNCRFWASIALHVKGMTVDEVAKRFRGDCHQDEATAEEQAVRGTFDPGYFAYTLGKLQILALRREAKEKLGAAFSLRQFHDALLAHGAPPVALVRESVLAALTRP
jgi:uncharacterized protein (DUF885 family)